MVFAIRAANEEHLTGDSEDKWGFRQIVALMLILLVIKGCIENYIGKMFPNEYRNNLTREDYRDRVRQIA